MNLMMEVAPSRPPTPGSWLASDPERGVGPDDSWTKDGRIGSGVLPSLYSLFSVLIKLTLTGRKQASPANLMRNELTAAQF